MHLPHKAFAAVGQRSNVSLRRSAFILWFVTIGIGFPAGNLSSAEPQRGRWTMSRMVGGPDPPPPYTTEPFANWVTWKRPIYVIRELDTANLLVVEQGGENEQPSRILRLHVDDSRAQPTELLTLANRLIYSVMPHPAYRENGWLYVFSNGPTGNPERVNRISRFTIGRSHPFACDPASEQVVLEWRSMGHDGGDMLFGNDGMMYLSTGDGTSDSDGWVSGQDITNLLGSVLRIDVDHPDEGLAYGIPKDNPFRDLPGARGEVWAFGLRNPWRMSVDRVTGHIWVGNNGQDLWETAHFVRRGDNYGWSVYEGNHPFYLHRQLGPAPFVPPTIEHHHREARSLTGGVTYRGTRYPELEGVYCYGDYSTGKIWGARHDGTELTWHRELADTKLQIAGFGTTDDGDLLIVDHGSGLHHLIPNRELSTVDAFPRRLSATGIFASTAAHQLSSGIVEYQINAPAWADGAQVVRFIALPDESRIEYSDGNNWQFPEGAVLGQTLSLPTADGFKRIETRLMMRRLGEWTGYSYRWNAAEDDGELVDADGADEKFAVRTMEGVAGEQLWRFPSRAECMSCHSRAANYVLGLTSPQIDQVGEYASGAADQLQHLQRLELFTSEVPSRREEQIRLANPYDIKESLESRARSYLHVNCSGCHVEAGGGNARMRLEISADLEQMNIVSAFPQHDTLGIANGLLLAPGEPERSMLYQRVSRRGRGQMPPLVTGVVDIEGAAVLQRWIGAMERRDKFVKAWTIDDFRADIARIQEEGSADAGQKIFVTTQCVQCHRFGEHGGGVGPNLTDLGKKLNATEVLESILDPSQKVAPEFASTVIHTVDGRTLEGRVESENERVLLLRLSGVLAEPVTIGIDDIDERSITQRSTMPTGLLNSLERTEVRDLLKYLMTPPTGR